MPRPKKHKPHRSPVPRARLRTHCFSRCKIGCRNVGFQRGEAHTLMLWTNALPSLSESTGGLSAIDKPRTDLTLTVHASPISSSSFRVTVSVKVGTPFLNVNVVDLVDCRESTKSKWHEPDHYGFVLANPRPLSRPIPCSGSLSFWHIPDEIAKKIVCQVGKESIRGTTVAIRETPYASFHRAHQAARSNIAGDNSLEGDPKRRLRSVRMQ